MSGEQWASPEFRVVDWWLLELRIVSEVRTLLYVRCFNHTMEHHAPCYHITAGTVGAGKSWMHSWECFLTLIVDPRVSPFQWGGRK